MGSLELFEKTESGCWFVSRGTQKLVKVAQIGKKRFVTNIGEKEEGEE